MIYPQLMGVRDSSGHVQLFCKECKAPTQDTRGLTLMKICSECGVPLGEWIDEDDRDAELHQFAEKVRQQS